MTDATKAEGRKADGQKGAKPEKAQREEKAPRADKGPRGGKGRPLGEGRGRTERPEAEKQALRTTEKGETGCRSPGV